MARNQVSMPSRANASLLRGEMIPMDLFVEVCQCPHGLMPHCYRSNYVKESFKECHVSMPSRANASLLQYPFKNLGFMRFPEPVFAGICQNILTVTHFHAC